MGFRTPDPVFSKQPAGAGVSLGTPGCIISQGVHGPNPVSPVALMRTLSLKQVWGPGAHRMAAGQ